MAQMVSLATTHVYSIRTEHVLYQSLVANAISGIKLKILPYDQGYLLVVNHLQYGTAIV